jgi:hypothetical protein
MKDKNTMKWKKSSLLGLALAFAILAPITPTFAAEATAPPPSSSLLSVNRFSAEAFAVYNLETENPGAGLAINYDVYGGVGLKLESFAENTSGTALDNVLLSLTYQAPFKIWRFTPYVLAGGGRNFEFSEWNAHAGIGASVPLTDQLSLFGDYRYVLADLEGDHGLVRAGINWRF